MEIPPELVFPGSSSGPENRIFPLFILARMKSKCSSKCLSKSFQFDPGDVSIRVTSLHCLNSDGLATARVEKHRATTKLKNPFPITSLFHLFQLYRSPLFPKMETFDTYVL